MQSSKRGSRPRERGWPAAPLSVGDGVLAETPGNIDADRDMGALPLQPGEAQAEVIAVRSRAASWAGGRP
ncbi:hypothetical protein GCM10010436_62780 [Paractinoplanes durhamensis]